MSDGLGDDTLTIRRATAADIPVLLALRLDDLRASAEAPLSEEEETDLARRLDAFLQEAVGGQTWAVVVAETAEGLVGTTYLYALPRLPRADARWGYGYLSGVYVRPAHRRRGIGRALVVAAVGYAREIGLAEAFLWHTDATRDWYVRGGWQASPATLEHLL